MDELEDALLLEVRKKIYNSLKRSPGLHFRELQRRTKLATGSLQYHLDYLLKRHLLKQEKDLKFTRFYLVRDSFENHKEMNVLRQESLRKIVLLLLEKKRANNSQVSRWIGVSPSTASWHLSKLVEKGIVEKTKKGRKTVYTLIEPEKAKEILVKYKRSFLDEMVDNFVEVWQQI
ncbi:MAG: winged helix-turn-helix transcriptional regulator [archaeon]